MCTRIGSWWLTESNVFYSSDIEATNKKKEILQLYEDELKQFGTRKTRHMQWETDTELLEQIREVRTWVVLFMIEHTGS